MAVRITWMLLAATLSSPALSANDQCPKDFEDYGLFLQAQKSCGISVDYPNMKAMKVCAAATPKETAITLMDAGRRVWANRLMRSSLGTMCAEVLAKPLVTPPPRQRP